jgi:hypothetical protein
VLPACRSTCRVRTRRTRFICRRIARPGAAVRGRSDFALTMPHRFPSILCSGCWTDNARYRGTGRRTGAEICWTPCSAPGHRDIRSVVAAHHRQVSEWDGPAAVLWSTAQSSAPADGRVHPPDGRNAQLCWHPRCGAIQCPLPETANGSFRPAAAGRPNATYMAAFKVQPTFE